MTRKGKRLHNWAHGAGLQGASGTWGAGRGQQESKRRYGRWRPAEVDACVASQSETGRGGVQLGAKREV